MMKNKMDEYTVLRESALNWYEFQSDGDLLEICADNSMLTGLFCRRCRKVTSIVSTEEAKIKLQERFGKSENLEILTQTEIQALEGQYDYVVCMEGLEYSLNPVKSLTKWITMLKPEGILLVGADNRYGLKYFCGSREKHTGVLFDGVNGYLREKREGEGRSYSRKELCELIQRAGESKYKFYYPVPDSRIPQMIFTDDYQKGINVSERLVDYNYADSSMLGVEHRIFSEMIDAGALPFMSNSFLIEVVKEGMNSDIQYAVVTTDRGPEYAMATTIRRNGTVYKRAIWPEGEKNLRRLFEQTKELEYKGVPVVRTDWETDRSGPHICMPLIEKEGLSSVLERLSERNVEKFLELFDKIYHYIGKSCESNENTGRVFIDLAPCNAFYDECGEDDILFYDQEFVSDDATPKFAMYRTLKYFFASSPKARRNVSLEEMYARYAIDEKMVLEFEKKEDDFIKKIRNTNQYQWLFELATPNYKKMIEHMERYTQKEKPYRVGYVPGVYDLFHVGHLRLLERCKERCEHLIVGVLTDELVEFYKGKKPVIPYEKRAGVIAGLKVVDEVVPVDFNNTDKIKAWEQLRYDCHFSGDDHVGHWNDIMEELKKRGSNMEFFSYTKGISSTAIKEKMQE